MKKEIYLFGFGLFLIILLSLSFVSAVVVSESNQGKLYPGDQTDLQVSLTNNLNEDVTDVSLNVLFQGTGFIPIGSSEDSIDEIRQDKTKTFDFTIKAAQDIKPGDYNIPYSIKYMDSNDNLIEKQGSIGLIVDGKTELQFSSESSNPTVGERGKIILKVINTGLGDVKFVNIKLFPQGFTLLGSDNYYIGTVSSDDFETASFDVLYTTQNARLSAEIDYKGFDNKPQIENINLPLTIYSKEKSIRLGITKPSYTYLYILIIIILVVIWFAYRIIRKRRKKKSQLKKEM